MKTLLCFLAFAALLPAQGKPPAPRSEKSGMVSLLPDAGSFGGKAAKPPGLYAGDLYKYLDGGAEAFIRRGFVALIHQEYKARDVELTADIYDMGEPARGFEMYEAERPPDCRRVQVGREGYVDEGVLNFSQGKYYVKLMAFSDGGKTAELLQAVARTISGKIEAAGRRGRK